MCSALHAGKVRVVVIASGHEAAWMKCCQFSRRCRSLLSWMNATTSSAQGLLTISATAVLAKPPTASSSSATAATYVIFDSATISRCDLPRRTLLQRVGPSTGARGIVLERTRGGSNREPSWCEFAKNSVEDFVCVCGATVHGQPCRTATVQHTRPAAPADAWNGTTAACLLAGVQWPILLPFRRQLPAGRLCCVAHGSVCL